MLSVTSQSSLKLLDNGNCFLRIFAIVLLLLFQVTTDDIWKLPHNVQLKDAAVIIAGHSLAMLAFSKFVQPQKDERVVVTAGPAGLGLAAVDVAANVYGAKVLGVTDSEATGELLRERGAFQTLHFDKKLRGSVLKASGNKGATIIYDAVGAHMLDTIGSWYVSCIMITKQKPTRCSFTESYDCRW